jgi:ubiquinone/menaquinone biosynthesis C-methylase UbiE
MPSLSDFWFPTINDWALGERVADTRARVVSAAHGRVLEIGAGTGLNFAFYPRDADVTAIEPAESMRRRAESRLRTAHARIRIEDARARTLPFPDASFDTVVSTFTLCSVGDLGAALDEIRRVLAPSGALLIAEHCLDPEPSVARWQRRIQPLWGAALAGCQLTRDVPSALTQHGFDPRALETFELPLPRIVRHAVRGPAPKR